MPVCFHHNCLYLTLKPYLSGEWFSRNTSDAVREVSGSIPISDKEFYVCYFVVVVCLLFLHTPYFSCNSLSNVNPFSILNILHNLWRIRRVRRYRPSIFKTEQSSSVFQLFLCNTNVAGHFPSKGVVHVI